MSSDNGHPAERNTADELSDIYTEMQHHMSRLTELLERKKTLEAKFHDEILKTTNCKL